MIMFFTHRQQIILKDGIIKNEYWVMMADGGNR